MWILPRAPRLRVAAFPGSLAVAFEAASDGMEMLGLREPAQLPCDALGAGIWAHRAAQALGSVAREEQREEIAQAAIGELPGELLRLFGDVADRIDGLGCRKLATRLRTLNMVEQARLHIEANAERSFLSLELIDVVGLSIFQLQRSFKQVWGLTPAAYHRRARLQKAANLLDAGMSPGAVRERLDYPDAANFARAFRKLFGHPPTQQPPSSARMSAE